jgi:hypothetical protein
MKRFGILTSAVVVAALNINCARTGSSSDALGSSILAPSAVGQMAPDARGGKGGKPATGGTSSLALVMWTDNNGNGSPNFGDTVTFTVTTTATPYPTVDLVCSQNGSSVYGAQGAFYDGDPWPWAKYMTLASGSWTSGAADCTATLHAMGSSTALATLKFTAAE